MTDALDSWIIAGHYAALHTGDVSHLIHRINHQMPRPHQPACLYLQLAHRFGRFAVGWQYDIRGWQSCAANEGGTGGIYGGFKGAVGEIVPE